MTQTIWWHLRHGWRSVDEYTVVYKLQLFLSLRVTVHLLFSLLLQKKLESVFLPRYESLKLSHKPWHKLFDDFWRHGWRSVDEFSVLSREQVFFWFCVLVHLLFSILLPKTLKSVFLPRYESLKINHDTNYLMTSEDTLEGPLMSFQFYLKSKVFLISCFSPSNVFSFFLQKTLKSVFLPRYESLKKNHDTNFLMTSDDTVEDLLMSFQFFSKSKFFWSRVLDHLLFSVFLQKTLKSVFLPRYESLKLNHDTNYLMTSETRLKIRWWVYNCL